MIEGNILGESWQHCCRVDGSVGGGGEPVSERARTGEDGKLTVTEHNLKHGLQV